MNVADLNSIDEITMRLVHYLITKEDYQPVIVNGVENEVWLENTNKKYEIIRINANYIHNDEQYKFDMYKTKSIVKQINKKTFSIGAKALNILLNIGDNVKELKNDKRIDVCSLNDVDDIYKDELISSLFPDIKNDLDEVEDPMEFFMNVTFDINKKNEEKSRKFEKTFKKKTIIVTYILMAINILIFILSNVLHVLDANMFSSNYVLVKNGEFYRLFTAAFFHGDIIHLLCNMYALYILGSQVETFYGKIQYIIIYVLSIISGTMLSCVINGAGVSSVGASGAIFGLMGALLYFGFHYRTYLGAALTSEILPVLILNLVLGFSVSYIDNFAHIGGLVGGLFASMCVGDSDDKSDRINGIITTVILFGFLIYMLFFK